MTILRLKNKSTTSLAYAKVYKPRPTRMQRLKAAYERPGVNLTTLGVSLTILGVIACSCFIVGYCLVSVVIAAWEFFK